MSPSVRLSVQRTISYRLPMLVVLFTALLLGACGGSAAAPASSAPPAGTSAAPSGAVELARYQAADRQQVLEADARKEASLTWYTVMAGDAIDALTNGFQQKYPYLKVDVYRADETAIVTRATQEAQANKQVFDVVDLGSPGIDLIGDAKLLTPYFSPSLSGLPDELKSGMSGSMVSLASDWTTIIGFGWNTQLIPDGAVPKTQDDFMNPALSGKMSLAGTTTGYNWIGSILKAKGDEKGKQWLQDFAKQQKPTVQQISGKALLDLVAKGEVPASPTIYRDHVRQAQAQKAPVNWVPIEPDATLVTKMGIAAKAPHANAGLLFVDYILGEGQPILKDHFYTTGGEKLPFTIWPIGEGRTTDEAAKDQQAWGDLFKADFR
ncbi:MAG TPA: extracellular solute-binding protein [Chloroflexota bacterium]|nr:extracellular solute-binding protein [Chloroflexota bacterium]